MAIPAKWSERAPRLATIAKWVNEHTTLVAEIERGYCNTDRKIPGTRLRHPGKGRYGTRLKVWRSQKHRRDGTPYGPNSALLDHNAAETYRYNGEVVRWLEHYLKKHPMVLK